jgi:diguanylate cyclase (GGDEF)-like protein
MPNTYFRNLGFDQQRLHQHLVLYQLESLDTEHARQTHQLITSNLDQIVTRFFDFLSEERQAQEVFSQGYSQDKLRKSFSQYLETLGVEYDSEDYFESRLRLGVVHIWVGVNLSLFQSAFLRLQEILVDLVSDDRQDRDKMIRFILRISHLDMSLAILAYHEAQKKALIEQVDHRLEQVKTLKHQQQYDTLTQVLQRDSILEILENRLQQRRKSDDGFCIIMADIDHFKQVNDKFGHLCGDVVLYEIAQCLRDSIRHEDYVGRYGGEEFLLILNNNMETTTNISKRIIYEVANTILEADHNKIQVTISLGLTHVLASDDAHSIVARADEALYRAKQNGRNRFEIA